MSLITVNEKLNVISAVWFGYFCTEIKTYMVLRRFNITILIALISLIGVVVMQVYWVQNAIHLKEEQFNSSVSIAMKTVLNRILELNNDITLRRLAMKEPCNDEKTDITDVIPVRLIDSLLNTELHCMKVSRGFEYAVYNRLNNKMFIGNFKEYMDEILVSEHQQSVEALFKPGDYYFSIYFPKQKTLIFQQLLGWMFLSALFLMAVILSFWMTIRTVLRQKKLSEMKTDFINNMTHELKTPISTISIAAEMLLKEDIYRSEAKTKKYIGVIMNENNRLKNQVEVVLQSAILDKGDIKLRLKETDVHRLLKKIIENFELQMHESSGAIDVRLDALNFTISADRMHLSNVFSNLIDNAVKYSMSAPQITIKTVSKTNGIIVSVSDKGMGISKENQSLIFKNLYRVHTGNIHDVKGFGIGLFYVKKIVELHGGQISLSSEVNKGSTFEVFLPFKR